jgi:hypothetical protein
MELSKRTTVQLSPELHARLTQLARELGVSVGALMRTACERQYGTGPASDRVDAVRQLAELALPVADPATMKRESVPEADPLPV